MDRYLKKYILEDLKDKMVFLAGPRQVGKTTLSKNLVEKFDYLNWDIDQQKTRILSKEFKPSELWIFDEIHKYKNWRNYLKGLFDHFEKNQKILVTGSAQLDLLRKGGDSLQGRYFYQRLMPLSCHELRLKNQKDLRELYQLGGFPEPFLKSSQVFSNRWSKNYRERIIRQEVASNEIFQDLGTIEIMYNRLPDLVGGTLSINALSEDVQADHKTVAKWISSIEKLYGLFRISPFGAPQIKALKKAQKMFLFDWNAIEDDGARFENFVAVHLLKWVYFEQDCLGKNSDLRYYRDKFDREVDFVVIEGKNPRLFLECKLTDQDSTKGIRYLKSKFPSVRAVQIHLNGKKEFIDGHGIEHRPCLKFLNELV